MRAARFTAAHDIACVSREVSQRAALVTQVARAAPIQHEVARYAVLRLRNARRRLRVLLVSCLPPPHEATRLRCCTFAAPAQHAAFTRASGGAPRLRGADAAFRHHTMTIAMGNSLSNIEWGRRGGGNEVVWRQAAQVERFDHHTRCHSWCRAYRRGSRRHSGVPDGANGGGARTIARYFSAQRFAAVYSLAFPSAGFNQVCYRWRCEEARCRRHAPARCLRVIYHRGRRVARAVVEERLSARQHAGAPTRENDRR